MNPSNYRYQLEGSMLVIEELGRGLSVHTLAGEVLTRIETEAGPLVGKYILWQSIDGLWDLLLTDATRERLGMGTEAGISIYPLAGRTLTQVKQQLQYLIACGLIPGEMS